MIFDYEKAELIFSNLKQINNELTEETFLESFKEEEVEQSIKNEVYQTYIVRNLYENGETIAISLVFFHEKIKTVGISILDSRINSYSDLTKFDQSAKIKKFCKDVFGSLDRTFAKGKVQCNFDPKSYTWGVYLTFS